LIRVAALVLPDEQSIVTVHIVRTDWASVQYFALQKCRNIPLLRHHWSIADHSLDQCWIKVQNVSSGILAWIEKLISSRVTPVLLRFRRAW
jgi:hypothetical protein